MKASYTFQRAAKTCSTCQGISRLHHFPDIILMTCCAPGTSPSHRVTQFTWSSKNSISRIIPCAKTVLLIFSMGRIGQHPQWADSAAICILLFWSHRQIISRSSLFVIEMFTKQGSRPFITLLVVCSFFLFTFSLCFWVCSLGSMILIQITPMERTLYYLCTFERAIKNTLVTLKVSETSIIIGKP